MDRWRGSWWRLLLLAAVTGVQSALPPIRNRTCLRVNGVVPPENRTYAILNGERLPLSMARLEWASAIIETWMFRIIVEEVMGIHTMVGEKFTTSAPAFYAIAGCSNPTNFNDRGCTTPIVPKGHMILGVWDGFAESAIKEIQQDFPDIQPIDYGEFLYAGRDSIFARETSIEPAMAEEHLPLEYYKSYSHPTINVSKYFSSIFSINASQLQRCEDTKLAASVHMEQYLAVSGDTDGIVATDLPDGSKEYKAVCYRDNWWLAPACRSDPYSCIPYITGSSGWYLARMMQKAAAWEMPIAVAVTASGNGYNTIPVDFRVLFYWWWPDSAFLRVSPVELRWPPHNVREWSVGNKRTDSKDIRLSKWAYHNLRNRSNTGFQKPLELLDRMSLTKEDVDSLMIRFLDLGSNDEAGEKLACEWLNNNTDVWEAGWIPIETECYEGQGLIDAAGFFVKERADAKECKWCDEGWMSVPKSDGEGPTYICEECGAGSYQEQKGATECIACAPGRSALNPGTEVCAICEAGRYATRERSESCTACPLDFVTKLQGAVSEADCVCAEHTFRDAETRACQQCKVGMVCPVGSDELAYDPSHSQPTAPELKPGYWSSPDDPLSVYACENEKRCPGGAVGKSCQERLIGQACGHCEERYRWNGEQCRECQSSVITAMLFPVIPLVVLPALIVGLYSLSGDGYRTWGSWQNGAAATVFIVLNHYQVLGIVRGVNIAFPGGLAEMFDWFTVTTDVSGYFDPGCAGIGSFQSLLILRSLTPAFCAFMYVVVWLGSTMAGRFDRNLRMDPNRTLNGFFALIFTFFAGIASMAFTMFKCGPNPNGSNSLIADRAVTCYIGEWNGMVVIGVLAVALWCVGFGAVFLRAIYRAPKCFHDEKMQMTWKFLFIRYRPDVHWWALVFVVKGIALNLGFLVLGSGISQLWWILYMLTIYTCLVCAFRPWRHIVVNAVDAWAHFCLALACAALTWFAHTAETGTGTREDNMMNMMSRILIYSVLPPALVAMAHMVWRQTSLSNVAKKKIEMELIVNAFDTFSQASEDEQLRFLDALSEWDFWFLSMTSGIVHTELALRKCRGGYSVQKMEGSIASTPQQVQELRSSRRSRAPRTPKTSEVSQQSGNLHKMWV